MFRERTNSSKRRYACHTCMRVINFAQQCTMTLSSVGQRKLVSFDVVANLIDYNRCIDCVTFAPYMRIQFSDGSSSQRNTHQTG